MESKHYIAVVWLFAIVTLLSACNQAIGLVEEQDLASDDVVVDIDGTTLVLNELVHEGPVILLFYREYG